MKINSLSNIILFIICTAGADSCALDVAPDVSDDDGNDKGEDEERQCGEHPHDGAAEKGERVWSRLKADVALLCVHRPLQCMHPVLANSMYGLCCCHGSLKEKA